MKIINDKRDEILFFEYITSINIRKNDRTQIMLNLSGDTRCIAIGTYSSREKCEMAFNHLLEDLIEGKDTIQVLNDDAPELNRVQVGNNGFSLGNKRGRGKTK